MEQLDRKEIDDLLEGSSVVHLACADPAPYVTALSYVMLDGVMFFRTFAGRRITALRNDPRVAIEVSDVDEESGAWTSVVADGTVRFVEDTATKARVEAALVTKYQKAYETLLGAPSRPEAGEAYIVEVTLQSVSGRASGKGWGRQTMPGRM